MVFFSSPRLIKPMASSSHLPLLLLLICATTAVKTALSWKILNPMSKEAKIIGKMVISLYVNQCNAEGIYLTAIRLSEVVWARWLCIEDINTYEVILDAFEKLTPPPNAYPYNPVKTGVRIHMMFNKKTTDPFSSDYVDPRSVWLIKPEL
ncbi:hypothetical protein AXF42_Ash006829 [Apostasia shenzhenica]|uniref:Uncharacterized protein n=1 Tax=Apostasia shenzhenica TaxID=1088818 RepID=A0A2I0AJ98_9ASPA|nr:hypothetical protein AXF42_Ash006829 [Apostasia shenzhenica]